MLVGMKNIVGGGDGWVSNPDGSIQEVTLAASDTSVQFTNVPADDNYGLVLCFDSSTASTANTEPPKRLTNNPTYGTASGGVRTVTYGITTVTSAQAGTKARLRLLK